MSNSVKDKKILDVKNDNVAYTKCVQGEVNSRFLQVIFKDESQPYNLTGSFATMYMLKADNTTIFVDGTIMDAINGIALFPLTEQMSSILGSFNIIFKIYSTDPVSEMKVKGLVLEVEEGNIDNAIVSSNDFTALQSALGDVGNMNAHMENTNNPHNVTQEQMGYTASDVLAKLKTVDGSGSGLDADTLDGLNSTSFIQTTEKGAANGVMALPATLPAIGSMLKMGAGGMPVTATSGTDYGIRLSTLWTGHQSAVATLSLNDSMSNYKIIIIVTSYASPNVQLKYNNVFVTLWEAGLNTSYQMLHYGNPSVAGTGVTLGVGSDYTKIGITQAAASGYEVCMVLGIK